MSFLGHLDRVGEIAQSVKYDAGEDSLVVHSVQDVEPILKRNKELYGLDDLGYGPSREWRRVASIPDVIVHAWLKKGIEVWNPDHWPKIAAALDDSSFLYLRTAPGRVSDSPKREYFSGSGSRGSKETMEL